MNKIVGNSEKIIYLEKLLNRFEYNNDLKNGIMSFAQKINDKGEAIVRKSFRGGEGVRWDKGERDIIVGLKEIGIEDSFRKLFSYDVKEYSWKFNRKDNVIKRRFDHFFASKKFKVMDAKYLHNEKKLSDHSPLIVKYRNHFLRKNLEKLSLLRWVAQ